MKRYLAIFLLLLTSCNHKKHFFESWVSAEDQCTFMCDSYAQNYSGVHQYSMGVCICDNEEGNKAAKGYHMYLDNKCHSKDESRY